MYKGDRIVARARDLDLETRSGQAEEVRFQIAKRGTIAKTGIVDPAGDPYDESGFTSAVAGRIGSVKGPRTFHLPNLVALPTGELISLHPDRQDGQEAAAENQSNPDFDVNATGR